MSDSTPERIHPREISGFEGELGSLAVEIARLTYDQTQFAIEKIAAELERQSEGDLTRGRVKLATELGKTVAALNLAGHYLGEAWRICEPFLTDEEKPNDIINTKKEQKMTKPDLSSSFEWEGQTILVDWFYVDTKEQIPDLPWQQVYVIGDLNGKVPLVRYPNAKNNLPGGRTEVGESLEETMHREVKEELNMRVIDWQPIGYQKLTSPNGQVDYQFRVYARLEKLGEFAGDVGGSVIGYSLVDIDEVNGQINYGDVGELMVKRAKKLVLNN